MSRSDDDHSDLRIIAAVLAHKAGLNAVQPDPEQIAMIQTFAQQHGQTLDKEEIIRCLRKAQIELLERQLDNKE
jgi:hypothetical protein